MCRQPVVRAQTHGGSPITLNPLPTPTGVWLIDFDHAIPVARRLDVAPPGAPVLHERHLATCPRRAAAALEEVPPTIALPALVEALAVALARRTHEFEPGEVDGEPTDLCAASEPFTCGHVADHPVHATPRAVQAHLARKATA